ncbi:12184_t:CDS:1 [Gigaspora rosea]|nr:12184_t:CDS:1 [Gigaspora rosea]
MEVNYGHLFGGVYMDTINNKLIVNVKDRSMENATILEPFKNLISFNIVENSMEELYNQLQAKINYQIQRRNRNIYVYIDAEANDVLVIPNPQRSDSSNHDITKRMPPKTIYKAQLGDGIRTLFASSRSIGRTCSIGFILHSKKTFRARNYKYYAVTSRSCDFKNQIGTNNKVYLQPWDFDEEQYLPYKLGQIDVPQINYSIPYEYAAFFWEPNSLSQIQLEPAVIRNTGQDFEALRINRTETKAPFGHHICHSGFATHVTCGTVKGTRGNYVNEDQNQSEGYIFTNIHTELEDLGGTIFFFRPGDLGSVYLFGLQVLSSIRTSIALSVNKVVDATSLILNL